MKVTVNLKWEQAVPFYVEAIKRGDDKEAIGELMRLAKAMDSLNGKTVVGKPKERKKYTTRVACEICGKRFKKSGIERHKTMAHSPGFFFKDRKHENTTTNTNG